MNPDEAQAILRRCFVAGILLVLVGCSGDKEPIKYTVRAEVDFWSSNSTGNHVVWQGDKRIAVCKSFAEADSLCQALNEREMINGTP